MLSLPIFHPSFARLSSPCHKHIHVSYSGYFSGGKIFVSSELLACLWENFRGHGILNHTLVPYGTVSWVKISWLASQPRKPRKFYPPKDTRYTVSPAIPCVHCYYNPAHVEPLLSLLSLPAVVSNEWDY